MGSQMDRMRFSLDGRVVTEPAGNRDTPEEKGKKQKPMSRRLSASISACSSKMTEVLAWQATLDDNKVGLMLVRSNMFFCL